MLDFNLRLKPGDVSEAVNAALDRAMDARPEERRSYLGASALGDECDRRIQYQSEGLVPDHPSQPRMRRIFERGHLLEARAAGELQAAGFGLQRHDPQGEAFGFTALGGRFQGHIDGRLVEAPVAMTLPALWEHKALKAEAWRKVAGKGVAIATPKYAAQVAIYQAYLGLPAPALFTATNADTMEMHHELVAFDAGLAQRMSDRAVRIVKATQAGQRMPRFTAARGHVECRWCGFRDRCWEIDL